LQNEETDNYYLVVSCDVLMWLDYSEC